MSEPMTMALGVAIGKLLLRWADLNDTADALADARAGFSALRVVGPSRLSSGPFCGSAGSAPLSALSGASGPKGRSMQVRAEGKGSRLRRLFSDFSGSS